MLRCLRRCNRLRRMWNSVGLRHRLRKTLPEHLSEFCEVTSIHGLKYVGQRRRPLSERVCWALMFVISLVASSYLIAGMWRKWDKTPVIVSLDTALRPVATLPFPAITVCPLTKVKKSEFDLESYAKRFTKDPNNLTDDELVTFNVAVLLCYDSLPQNILNVTSDEDKIRDVIKKVSPSLKDIQFLVQWNWRQQGYYSEKYIEEVLTDEGLCYSFNTIRRSELFTEQMHHMLTTDNDSDIVSEWNPDVGYYKTAGLHAYPKRSLGAGEAAGVDIFLMMAIKDLDYRCTIASQGFKIYLHNPAEFPRLKQQYFLVPLDQIVYVSVTPDVTTTDEELRTYEPSRRQCFFSYERQLRFFQVYTQQNCALECLANYTLIKCGCVGHYMPRAEGTPICSAYYLGCMKYAADKLIEATAMNEVNPEQQDKDSTCNCLQSCNDIKYNSERSQAPLEWKKLFLELGLNDSEMNEFTMTRTIIFLKDAHYISTNRCEMYGRLDFLANCGGLLGLCMGVSILSLVELLYWLFLRLCCSSRWLRRKTSRCTSTEDKDIV